MRFLTVLYTITCVFGPILRIYTFVGGSFTVLDTCTLLFYILSIQYLFNRNICRPFLALFVFVMIHSCIILLYNSDGSIFVRAMHLANYIFFVAFFNNTFFKMDLAQKLLRYGAVIATLFLIIQHVASIFLGVQLVGIYAPLATHEANMDNMVSGTDIYRYASFFIEPAGYGVFIVSALAQELFYQKESKLWVISLICLGGILSTSNTAIACIVLLLGIYFYIKKMLSVKTFLLLLSFVAIFIIAQPFLEAITNRIEAGNSYANRFSGYDEVFKILENPLLGMGFVSPDDMPVYLSGFARLLMYFGFIGIIFYTIIYVKVFFSASQKITVLVFLFLNVGSNTLLGASFLPYSCFIAASMKKRKDELESYINRRKLAW